MSDVGVTVARWVEKAKGRQTAVLRAVAQAALDRVQALTPAGPEDVRGNWSAVLPDDAIPTAGSPTIAALATVKAGDVVHIVNPVAHARTVEYGGTDTHGDGTFRVRQGQGMVRQTVTELPQIAGRVVREPPR